MSAADDLVILNQAKALEGMRQRLRSHNIKLSDRQKMIDKMETMIARRDEKIGCLQKTIDFNVREIQRLQQQVPESYQSELTRKCEEVDRLKKLNDTWKLKYFQLEELSQTQSDAIGRLKARLGI